MRRVSGLPHRGYDALEERRVRLPAGYAGERPLLIRRAERHRAAFAVSERPPDPGEAVEDVDGQLHVTECDGSGRDVDELLVGGTRPLGIQQRRGQIARVDRDAPRVVQGFVGGERPPRANPMNLMTDRTDDRPEGGWELLRLIPKKWHGRVGPVSGRVSLGAGPASRDEAALVGGGDQQGAPAA